MPQEKKVVTTSDFVIAGIVAGGSFWFLRAGFGGGFSTWLYASVAAFFFLMSLGQLVSIRNRREANNAVIEMNERQKQTEIEAKSPPTPVVSESHTQDKPSPSNNWPTRR